MAVDKLVDSTQLDADLTSIANAIRTKGGTSAQMAFPAGFISSIQNIPGGAGTDYLAIDISNTPFTYENETVVSIRGNAFRGSPITRATFPNVTTIGSDAFRDSSLLGVYAADFPSLSIVAGFGNGIRNFGFACFPQAKGIGQTAMNGSRELNIIDIGSPSIEPTNIGGSAFLNDLSLKTLVLRYATIISLAALTTFNGTPFASGGTGGTIYIPKVLYDHLGDGTALDYKAATNWSTYDSYGTITWAQIEGSIYETQYADGTPVT